MPPPDLRLAPAPRPLPPPGLGLGQALLGLGALDADTLARAEQLARRRRLDLGEVLLRRGTVTRARLCAAEAFRHRTRAVDLASDPPDPQLVARIGATRCLREGAVPWRAMGGATVIATCRPERFDAFCADLPPGFGQPIMALTDRPALEAAIARAARRRLAVAASSRTPEPESCRFWYARGPRRAMALGVSALVAAILAAPVPILGALTLWAAFTLGLASLLKLAALVAGAGAPPPPSPPADIPSIAPMPVVSLLVPLFRETEMIDRLLDRLGRLDYPPELLDICLIVEEGDTDTRAALDKVALPPFMRVIEVPEGQPRTKPRALNYALDFCRGSIVGIYDAEDAPERGQIRAVVRQFRRADPQVACLQGALDFYNARANWLSRCFTIEYAGWFRVVLPGLARLGLALPLGGTTVFFRRAALEEVGGWDAHNVTEDADLGLRLARHGYRTEMVASVTLEEANCHPWPWVRQRSRWLKGYAMTWSTLMRRPHLLWRQLGAWRFFGAQVLFLTTLSQFLLMPLLWSFWLILLGLPHPLSGVLGGSLMGALCLLFVASGVIDIAVGVAGLRRAGRPGMIPWVPSLHFYFPLAALASYKALVEIASNPFFWDKTRHGHLSWAGQARGLPEPGSALAAE